MSLSSPEQRYNGWDTLGGIAGMINIAFAGKVMDMAKFIELRRPLVYGAVVTLAGAAATGNLLIKAYQEAVQE